MNYGLKAYFSGFFYFLVLKVDQLMVQYQCGSASTGFYSTAVSMGDAVCILPSVICVVLFPRLSSIKDLQKKWGMARQAVFWTAAGILPLFLFAGVLAKPLVGFLFGDRYLPSLIPFLLLLPGLYFLSVQWVAARFLYSLGYPKQVIANWVIAAVFNIVLNLWAMPRWGIEGASVTSSATYFLVLILTLLTIRRYIRSGGKNRLR
jgi:O-antigen/teichoic acid export membrane protein